MINQVATALYNALNGNAALMTKLGGTVANGYKCYNVLARNITFSPNVTVQHPGCPFLTFGLLTDVPMGVFSNLTAIDDSTWFINIFSDSGSAKEAGEIFDLVDTVLNDGSLTVTGYTHLKCVREYVSTPIWDDVTKVWQLSLRYRIWIDKD